MKKFKIIISLCLSLGLCLCVGLCVTLFVVFRPVAVQGKTGKAGKSAYELAVDSGFSGTEEEWLASLKGENGKNGLDGANGNDGEDGTAPIVTISADGYWVINGNVSNVKAVGEKGQNGSNGKSAYQVAVENGFVGSEEQWLESLKGADGENGTDGLTPTVSISSDGYWIINGTKTTVKAVGKDGRDGIDGDLPEITINSDGYWVVGGVATTTKATGRDGVDGTTPTLSINKDGYWVINGVVSSVKATGIAGSDGLSAYQIAVKNGFVGSEEQWLESLKGAGSSSVVSTTELKNSINKGLLSSVAIISKFTSTSTSVNKNAAGSGVVYKDNKENGDAYIITNYHVVYDGDYGQAASISCYLYGQYNLSVYAMNATLVGGSHKYDIAVLKITGSEVYKNSIATPITIADSNFVSVGDRVALIGNARGLGIGATTGVISVDSQNVTIENANKNTYTMRSFRTDATVNGGNSGGGAFNDKGEYIGTVHAKSIDVEIEGMGFIIPSSISLAVADKIIKSCDGTNTKISVANLGVELGLSGSSMQLVDGEPKIVQTVAIASITNASYNNSLLKQYDIIVSATLNGKTVAITREFHLTDLLLRGENGDILTLEIKRAGVSETIKITLNQFNTVA